MGLLGETKPINKMVITIDGDDYEFSGGGGTPGPNTVGTEQIIDGAVEEEDLNDHVKSRMTVTHDSSSGGLRIGGYAKPGEIPADNKPVGQGGGEDTDDDETGFDAGADNGDEDI
jgi:hypothetical protein